MSLYKTTIKSLLDSWVSTIDYKRLVERTGTLTDFANSYSLGEPDFEFGNDTYKIWAWVNKKDPLYRDTGEGMLFVGRQPNWTTDGWSYFESKPIQEDNSRKNYIKVRT
jgi:hypothetical protein